MISISTLGQKCFRISFKKGNSPFYVFDPHKQIRGNRYFWLGLATVILMSGSLHFLNLEVVDFQNRYYAAAVISMLKSWHNLFFVAAEPGGIVSVDKPPLGLWIQALFTFFLGNSSFAMLLPQLLCGIFSSVILYSFVYGRFGALSGVLAGIVYNITPIILATDRNNTLDSSLNLVLLLAAWAFVLACEKNTFSFLVLGTALVGIGFNIKMFQAYIPLPAFYLYYFLSAEIPIKRKLRNLFLATLILLLVSFTWVMIVDFTPANLRPYVGGSRDNSMLNLVFRYNGITRFTGLIYPGTGIPGVFRLFDIPMSKEASWMLPFAFVSMLLIAFQEKISFPLKTKHQMLFLWGGWLISCLVIFSAAPFIHEYYLSMIAGPLSILTAIGFAEFDRLSKKREIDAVIVLIVASILTLGFQLVTATSLIGWKWWFIFPLIFFLSGILLLIYSFSVDKRLVRFSGIVYIFFSLLVVPSVWSVYTIFFPSSNQMLPNAYDGSSISQQNHSGFYFSDRLLNFLQENTHNVTYLIAVPSAKEGADFVISSGRPVLYIGGFLGTDKILTADTLNTMIDHNEVRYVLWQPSFTELIFKNPYDLTEWLIKQCSPVPYFKNEFTKQSTNRNSLEILLYDPYNNSDLILYDCAK